MNYIPSDLLQHQNMLTNLLSVYPGLDKIPKIPKDLLDLFNQVDGSVQQHGWMAAATELGSRIEDQRLVNLAGIMRFADLYQNVPDTVEKFVKVAEGVINPDILDWMARHSSEINQALLEGRRNELNYDWFSASCLITNYLLRRHGREHPIESPQMMFMRVATQMYYNHGGITKVLEVYHQMSARNYTPASPTLFNAGTICPQMASCFLYGVDDSIPGIFDGVTKAAIISKGKGGVGVDISHLRHSEIGTSGSSKGIVPWCKIYDDTALAVNQGSKRPGGIALSLRVHHIDIMSFIGLRKPIGDPDSLLQQANVTVMTNNLFWHRVRQNGRWTVFCPKQTSDLNRVYGAEFERRYLTHEANPPKAHRIYQARDILEAIVGSQIMSGMPYVMNMDAVNYKSNQKHMGYIRTSNLCQEIVEYMDDGEIASCNLSSLSLSNLCLKPIKQTSLTQINWREHIDFELLARNTQAVVDNLNRIIDTNWVDPLIREAVESNNAKHRPIGIGVSGLAELLMNLDLPFDDPRSYQVNRLIFACIYWNGMVKSLNLAIINGYYPKFPGSPLSQGKFQFDLWAEEYQELNKMGRIDPSIRTADQDIPIQPSEWGVKWFELESQPGMPIKADWNCLRELIKVNGIRNSLVTSIMPTASSSSILNNTEMVEAPMSNIFSRRLIAGTFIICSPQLQRDLREIQAWNHQTVELIQADNGSVRYLDRLIQASPDSFPGFSDWSRLAHLQKKYKTMFEIPNKCFIKMSAERARYIDQSQSLNLYCSVPEPKVIEKCLMYGQLSGLKTICYYLRSQSAAAANSYTISPEIVSLIEQWRTVSTKVTTSTDPTTTWQDKSASPDNSPGSINRPTNDSLKNSGIVNTRICNDEICVSCSS